MRVGMGTVILFLTAASALAQGGGGTAEDGDVLLLDLRARDVLAFGSGTESGTIYYDVPITDAATEGVLVKLGYTQRGGELSFDLHHRASLGEDGSLPGELLTVVEVITGASNRIGRYTMLARADESPTPVEEIDRASTAEVDRYVVPLGTRRITIKTDPGPQSISIVGREMTVRRDGFVTHIDTPGTRIAMVSNIEFVETRAGETLTFEED